MAGSEDHFPFDTPAPDGAGDRYEFRKPVPKPDKDSFDAGLSLTRLIVGGILVGMDGLMDRLLTWDTIRRKGIDQLSGSPGQSANGSSHSAGGHEPIVPKLRYQYSERFLRQRHTAVGLIFASRSALLAGWRRLGSWQQRVYDYFSDAADPYVPSRMSQPLQRRFNDLVQRGEREVTAWEHIGRRESEISRELAQTALHETVEDSIEYLAENPEVKELVQTQSTGLADEAVEEIRERAVSADNFVEGLVRYFLRRAPRQEIPPPPSEVRERAERIHPERYQKSRRQP